MLKVLDLFSGIGGFTLGLERTGGFKTVAFCEIDPYCQRILAKHWPEVPCVRDIHSLGREQLADMGAIDVVCGGFPCQDISAARRGGNAAGLNGSRSGLWTEAIRVIAIAKPVWAVIENVDRLRSSGIDRLLAALERIDYACETLVVGAGNAGSPHLRKRVWLVAHAAGERRREIPRHVPRAPSCWQGAGYSTFMGKGAGAHWAGEPNVGRVAHGVSARVDRLRGLGNAVVPQIPEAIGWSILAAESGSSKSIGESECNERSEL